MNSARRNYVLVILFAELSLFATATSAMEFEPGAGVAAEYTDNARLTSDDTVNDLITVGYVGARLAENEGRLKYDATTSFNNHSYTQDTYKDQRYFNLAASADWEMIEDRFNWILRDYFRQRPINTLDANTPNNLQDSNTFTFGANMRWPVSGRQSISVSPFYNQYYYENQITDNKQLSITASWNYQMYRLTGIGLSLSSRKINYTEQDIFGNSLSDTSFTNAAFIVSGQRPRSNYSVNLGATNVKRDGGGDSTGFSGNINWLVELSSRSKFKTLLSTDLTDTSSVATGSALDPTGGSPEDVQVSTDVIRNSVFNLTYLRDDVSFNSSVWANYRKVTYSDSPFDRIVQAFGGQLNYPVTQLLSSGAYINYNRTEQLDTSRIDERYTVGGNMKYQLSRKWHSLIDAKYRTKESTDANQNYDEFSVFASLVYGFGDVYRPTRAGGF